MALNMEEKLVIDRLEHGLADAQEDLKQVRRDFNKYRAAREIEEKRQLRKAIILLMAALGALGSFIFYDVIMARLPPGPK